MTDHKSLPEALAAFQANLPTIGKGKTAKVEMKGGGSYTYDYADLADVVEAVMPLLTEHGLSFAALPTFDSEGRFVLSYRLLHTSGESLDGAYPLPNNTTPQQVGSAITYARRYCLCAVTGVAPDEDDDGRAAQQASERPQQAPTTVQGRLVAEADRTGAANALGWVARARYGTSKLPALDDDQAQRLLDDFRADPQAISEEAKAAREAEA